VVNDAKLEHRAPEVMIETDGKPKAPVINIRTLSRRACRNKAKPKCEMR
jgi:hypothetical protein